MTDLAEEILDYDDEERPIEKVVVFVGPDGDVHTMYYHKLDQREKWEVWMDCGSWVSPSLFLKAAENLLALAGDEEES